jgi:hypothetical protein
MTFKIWKQLSWPLSMFSFQIKTYNSFTSSLGWHFMWKLKYSHTCFPTL